MPLSPANLLGLLGQLDDALALEGAAPGAWVVCGGTALILRGLSERATRDIDVIGAWSVDEGRVIRIGEFVDATERAIARVSAAHPELRGLGARWVNLGPQEILRFGLPSGCIDRLMRLEIGDRLSLYVPARGDLIALKVYAAADDMGSRQTVHSDDLRSLAPTAEEISAAVAWVCSLPDPHHRIRPALKRLVEELGHHDIAYYL